MKNDNYIKGTNNVNGCWPLIRTNEDQNTGNIFKVLKEEKKKSALNSFSKIYFKNI